jgi:hypothetical protein
LLDPQDVRLQEIAAATRCTWRGTVLSLGSAESAFSPALIRRIRDLLELTRAGSYTDVVGFRRLNGCDLGHAQAMPCSAAAAALVAARQAEASQMLGLNVTLAPVRRAVAPPAALDESGLLKSIASACEARFALDAGRPVAGLAGRVATIDVAGQDEAAWAELPALTRHFTPRAIVVRRNQALFSPHTLVQDAARAAAAVEPTRSAAEAIAPDELAALYAYQAAFIGYFHSDEGRPVPPELDHMADDTRTALACELRQWRNWRKQMADAHKTQQIAAFLMRGRPDALRSAQ